MSMSTLRAGPVPQALVAVTLNVPAGGNRIEVNGHGLFPEPFMV